MPYTMGRYILIAVVLVLFFNIVHAAVSYIADLLNTSIEAAENNTKNMTDAPFLQETRSFLKNAWSWEYFILTSSIALAVLIFIALVYEAFEMQWR